MAKIKLFLTVIFLFYFVRVVFGSGSSESGSASKSKSEDSQNTTSNLKPAVNSELSLVLQRLEAQELRIQELEKSGEECKSFKMFYQKSHEELKQQLRSSKKSCDEQIKTLRKEVDEMKAENSAGEDVWLLTPPIRGRHGQKGEPGDSGPNGRAGEKGGMGQNGRAGPKGGKGDQGPIGLKGDRGGTGEKGDSGRNGRAGKAGEKGGMGQNGGQGERGMTGPKGDRGEKGERGQLGPKGQRGDKGEKGDSGAIATAPGENPRPKGQVQIPTPRPTAAGPKATSTIPAPPSKLITSCSDAMEILPAPRSQKQAIYPHGNSTSVEVLCDFETDGGGWTIIQKRTSGPKEEFKQNWSNYTQGFGSLDKNFWLGLENIHALTKNGDQELRIQLEDFEGEKKYAKYSRFSISDASDFYRLTLAGFVRDSTFRRLDDDMTDGHNGQRFSTLDNDNDNYGGNCAVRFGGGGGWWFNECGHSNLNGLYFEKKETVLDGNGIWWDSWKGYYYSMAKTEMKIRKKRP